MLKQNPTTPVQSPFCNFLYADVGDDSNGVSLTVLSALARQNIDPWEQAADLSRLPAETARSKVLAMLEALPGHRFLEERSAIAGRLVTLLPRVPAGRVGASHILHRLALGDQSAARRELSVVLIYVVSMIFGLWIFSAVVATPPDRSVATAATTTESR